MFSSQFYDADTSSTAPSGIEPGGTMETYEATAVSESEPPDSITWEGLEQVKLCFLCSIDLIQSVKFT
jgi:hypothetical protein